MDYYAQRLRPEGRKPGAQIHRLHSPSAPLPVCVCSTSTPTDPHAASVPPSQLPGERLGEISLLSTDFNH